MPTLIRHAVREVFTSFSARFEGVRYHLYADCKQLVTIGIGNLVDPLPRGLPLLHADGTPATSAEIAAEWSLIKHELRLAHDGADEAAKLCNLHLTQTAVADLVDHQLEANARQLLRLWPSFGDWPAPAQLALCSWAWACGAGAEFPKMTAALDRDDFAAAAEEIKLREEGNPGLAPRNVANRALLLQAVGASDPEALVLPWLMPPGTTTHAPEPDHLSDADRALALDFIAFSLQRGVNDAIGAGRAARAEAEWLAS